jgi:hypothetical protein
MPEDDIIIQITSYIKKFEREDKINNKILILINLINFMICNIEWVNTNKKFKNTAINRLLNLNQDIIKHNQIHPNLKKLFSNSYENFLFIK